jgi:hypothetical protein
MSKEKVKKDKKLAAGAKEIEKAKAADKAEKAEAEKKALVVSIPKVTRPIQEIIGDRVTVLPGHIGLKIADGTPIEENLAILDWATQLSDHAGFMIGDVLLAGEKTYGETYNTALNQTGRAYSTLKNYKMVAKAVPPSKRIASLSFSHYKAIQGLLTEPKVIELVEEVGKKVSLGETFSKDELRIKALKVAPKKAKKPKKATSGKGKRKKKPEPPPYVPTSEEQNYLDEVETAAGQLAELLKNPLTLTVESEVTLEQAAACEKTRVINIVLQCGNREKQRWVKMFEPFVTFYNRVDRSIGYT